MGDSGIGRGVSKDLAKSDASHSTTFIGRNTSEQCSWGIVMRKGIAERPAGIRGRSREIVGCALIGTLGILLLDALTLQPGIYYYSDDVYVLYQVAVHSLTATPWLVI